MNVKMINPKMNALIKEFKLYYDRVRIWVDTDRSLETPEIQSAFENSHAKTKCDQLLMNECYPQYRQQIDLFQPHREHLLLVEEVLNQYACNYRISRVEPAIDWMTENEEDARELWSLILNSLTIVKKNKSEDEDKNKKKKICEFVGDTVYLADKSSDGVVPVIYLLKQDKHCPERQASGVHFEFRWTKHEQCAQKNILTLQNLVDYDPRPYFKSQIRFYQKLPKTACGKLLAKAQGNTEAKHRDTYIRYCDKFIAEINASAAKVAKNDPNPDRLKSNYTYETMPLVKLVQEISGFKDELESQDNTEYHQQMIEALFDRDAYKII